MSKKRISAWTGKALTFREVNKEKVIIFVRFFNIFRCHPWSVSLVGSVVCQ